MLATQQNLDINPQQLLPKLSTILFSLQQQSQEIKRFYENKISDLQKQIQDKENQNKQISNKLKEIQKKYQQQEWKIIQKDNTIEDLNKKIRNITYKFKQKLHSCIDQIDLTQNGSNIQNNCMGNAKNNQQTNKRINISQYYIKSIESSKVSTKTSGNGNGNETTPSQYQYSGNYQNSSMFQTVRNALISDSDPAQKVYGKKNLLQFNNNKEHCEKLEKVKSMDEKKFKGFANWKVNDHILDSESEQSSLPIRQRSKESQRQSQKQKQRKMQRRNQIQNNILNLKNKVSTHRNGNANPNKLSACKPKQTQNVAQSIKISSKKVINAQMPILQQKWKKISAFQHNEGILK